MGLLNMKAGMNSALLFLVRFFHFSYRIFDFSIAEMTTLLLYNHTFKQLLLFLFFLLLLRRIGFCTDLFINVLG